MQNAFLHLLLDSICLKFPCGVFLRGLAWMQRDEIGQSVHARHGNSSLLGPWTLWIGINTSQIHNI